MPYGFGGGLAAGFDTGVSNGTQLAEVRLKREALLKEQINEKVKLAEDHANVGMTNLAKFISSAPNRNDPNFQKAVQAYQSQLADLAQGIGGLGPEGEQAAQRIQQNLNNVLTNSKTMGEANTAENLSKVEGAREAAKQAFAGMQPTPPPVASATPTLPSTPGVMPVAAQAAAEPVTMAPPGSMPAAAPPVEVAQAAPEPSAGPTEQELFNLFLGVKDDKDDKLPADTPGRFALMEGGVADLEMPVSKDDETLGRELLSKPSSWHKMQALGLPSKVAGGELYRAKQAAERAARGALYSLTGATANDKEEAQLYDFFVPTILDDDPTAKSKVDALYAYLGQAKHLFATRKGKPISKQEALLMAGMTPKAVYGNEDDTSVASQPSGVGSSAAASSAPQPGVVEDGYRFKGGNPSDPNSWEKVQ